MKKITIRIFLCSQISTGVSIQERLTQSLICKYVGSNGIRSRVNVNEGVSRWWGYLILWAFSVCLCYVSQTTVVYLLCIQAQAENRRNEIYHTSGQTLLSRHPLTYPTGGSSQQTQTLAVLHCTYAPLYNNSITSPHNRNTQWAFPPKNSRNKF